MSKVADFSTKIGDFFTCDDCGKKLKKPNDGAQSGIVYHLKSKHPDKYAKVVGIKKRKQEELNDHVPPKKNVTIQPSIIQSFNRFADDSEESKNIDRAVTQWICRDGVPFNAVEKPRFQNLIKKLRSQFKLKSRSWYSRTGLPNLYEEYEEKLQKELRCVENVSIGIDLWSDDGGKKQVIGVLVFFVTETKFTHRVLDVIDVSDGRHTGELISDRLSECLDRYKLRDKMKCLVRDGASNVKLTGKLLDVDHFDCLNHRLHLAAMKGIESLGNTTQIIQKFKKISRKLKKSYNTAREFKEIQIMLDLPTLQLKKSIDTRWNSVLDMFQRALKCKQALCLLLADHPALPQVSSVEWEFVEAVCEILQPIKDVSDKAQLNFLPPHAKELLFKKALEIEPVDRARNDTDYFEKEDDDEEDEPFMINQNTEDAKSTSEKVDKDVQVQLEVQKWFLIAPNSKTNAFLFWKDPVNIAKFPHLHQLAKSYHSAPPGTAEVERTFSTAGYILNDLRKSLSHDTFSKLLKLNKNIDFFGF